MNQIVQNELIESAKVGFFDEGLNRGSYGLTIKLRSDAPKGALSPKVYSAVKQLVEEELPLASKKSRILIPDSFHATDSLRWLIAALKRFSIQAHVIYGPSFGESDAIAEASWKILKITEPLSCFLDFDELWYEPEQSVAVAEFPLWPLPHPIYLYLKASGREVSEVISFMKSSKFPWSIL